VEWRCTKSPRTAEGDASASAEGGSGGDGDSTSVFFCFTGMAKPCHELRQRNTTTKHKGKKHKPAGCSHVTL
jgi:hypothetical protein